MYKEWPVAYSTTLLPPYYRPLPPPYCHPPHPFYTLLQPFYLTLPPSTTLLQPYYDSTVLQRLYCLSVLLFCCFVLFKSLLFCFLLFRRYKAPFLFDHYSFTVKACFCFKSFQVFLKLILESVTISMVQLIRNQRMHFLSIYRIKMRAPKTQLTIAYAAFAACFRQPTPLVPGDLNVPTCF